MPTSSFSIQEIVLKHLPGRHEQKTHGDRGAEAGGAESPTLEQVPLKWKMPPVGEPDVYGNKWILPDKNDAPEYHQCLTVSNTEKWARQLEANGWDVDAVVKESLASGRFPQTEARNYPADLGTHAGEFTAYRVGQVANREGGGIFFGPNADEIGAYTGIHPGEQIKTYKVTLNNPCIVKDKTQLFRKFFPGDARGRGFYEWVQRKEDAFHDKIRREHRIYDPAVDKAPSWEDDSDNAAVKKLRSMGFDSLVILNPGRPATREIAIFDASQAKEIATKETPLHIADIKFMGRDAYLDAEGWHCSDPKVEKILRSNQDPNGEYVPNIDIMRIDKALGLGAIVKELNLSKPSGASEKDIIY